MKKLLRRCLRAILKHLTLMVLKKHHPHLIVVTGDGQTSLVREVFYSALQDSVPTRRNLEAPEAEFSVPLTILGWPDYPKTIFGWIKVIAKTCAQLTYLKPYTHYLILELAPSSEEILDYWLKAIKPEVTVVVGSLPPSKIITEKNSLLISQEIDKDFLTPVIAMTKEIGHLYHLSENTIDRNLQSFELPSPRIRLLESASGRTLVDASFYYSPPHFTSIQEILGDEESFLLATDKVKADENQKVIPLNPRSPYWLEMIKKDPNKPVIILGQKRKTAPLLKELLQKA
ncbi:MAG: hypothetical protein Q8N84_00175 [bacterium]|nr:hypothetical protein [bacterium]